MYCIKEILDTKSLSESQHANESNMQTRQQSKRRYSYFPHNSPIKFMDQHNQLQRLKWLTHTQMMIVISKAWKIWHARSNDFKPNIKIKYCIHCKKNFIKISTIWWHSYLRQERYHTLELKSLDLSIFLVSTNPL